MDSIAAAGDAAAANHYLQGLTRSFAVIVVSEIGDKTFLLAAIMAMRHPRMIVLAGAFAALALMSVLSAILGHILPSLLPRRYTTVAAALLFFVFGGMMLKEGIEMEGGNEKIQEEMREVQKEVEDAEEKVGNTASPTSARRLENAEEGMVQSPAHAPLSPRPLSANGSGMSSGSRSKEKQDKQIKQLKQGVTNLVQLFVHPILLQTFIMTFLAEWGDRSQISTIALAAAHNVTIVTIGTIAGHLCCTAAAVMGGRWLATKISVKHVTLGGAVLFLIFGVAYVYEAYAWDEAAEAAEALSF